ncbi:unnamed protein product [Closterium sp. NIES-53]
MYLMTCTRPDLAYPLRILARYVVPGRHRPEHWEAAKRVLRYLCSTSGMGLVLGGRAQVVLTRHADASWVDDLATQRSSQGYTFSLGSGSVSWQSTCSSSVLSSSCEAEIYARAMAAQELCCLTNLLTNLGERPRSSPVLYVDNKAMIALCQEHRLEHRTKHIALHYFLARELQQHGQFRLAYMATRANSADIFTKALPPAYAVQTKVQQSGRNINDYLVFITQVPAEQASGTTVCSNVDSRICCAKITVVWDDPKIVPAGNGMCKSLMFYSARDCTGQPGPTVARPANKGRSYPVTKRCGMHARHMCDARHIVWCTPYKL